MHQRVEADSVAEAYLGLLAARGIDYFFGNGGTDFAPIVEAYAKRMAREEMLPRPIAIPHETVAVAMAHGYTMVTGRPQVVMVHTLPGTANALNGIINAARTNVPMLFSAGRTPITEDGAHPGARDGSIHWAQESFDQASMVREWVKWDYELRSGADLEGVVDRALAITASEPQGPVYLTLPREVLAQPIDDFSFSDQPRMPSHGETSPSPALIAQAAEALAAAKNPILLTRAAGRDPGAVQPLVDLAELLGMAVFDAGALYVNFPQDHPLYAGADAQPHLPDADLVVALEADVPWLPSVTAPADGAAMISIGQDPLYSRYPVRGFRVDIALAGSPRLTLEALVGAITAMGLDPAAAQDRRAKWAALGKKRRDDLEQQALAVRDRWPIAKPWFTRCLAEHLGDDTILLNELGVDLAQTTFTKPGQFYGVAVSGGLGWGVGAALGAKLAAPEKTVVCCVGDGSYIFGSATAGHMVSMAQNLPVLTIVWNNGIWGAVQNATRRLAPEGWAVQTGNFAVTALSQAMNYEMVCQAAGGYGERVEDPAEVPAAIERGLHAVRVEKRQALLNVVGAGR